MKLNNKFINPIPTIDIIIKLDNRIILIERANPPNGWAIPGGFVEYGESYEECAIREAYEETSLNIKLEEQFNTYSSPLRDYRQHIATTVFIATALGTPKASSDAKRIGLFSKDNIPSLLTFDHKQILDDYFDYISGIDKNKIFKKYLNFF